MRKLFVLLFVIATSYNVRSQNQKVWKQIDEKLPIPYENAAGQRFGTSIDLDGNYAVVGATGYKSGQGCAYVLKYDGLEWDAIATLTSENGFKGENLGWSVAISGDVILVGTYATSSGSEFAYIYKKPEGDWQDMTESAILSASDYKDGDGFGWDVDILNNIAVVSSRYDNDRIGAVYMYEMPDDGWKDMTETRKIIPSDGVESDHFGYSIALSQDILAVGSTKQFTQISSYGAVYIYEKSPNGWDNYTEVAKLAPTDGSSFDFFGISIDIDQNTIVIGAEGKDAVYVFEKSISGGWANTSQIAKFQGSDINQSDSYFGNEVYINDSIILVGTERANNYKGATYLFKMPESGWTDSYETRRLVHTDAYEWDYFGSSICMNDSLMLIGAENRDTLGSNSGVVYSFFNKNNNWLHDLDTSVVVSRETFLDNSLNQFGYSVSIDDSIAVVGAPGYSSYRGTAYIYQYDGIKWELINQIYANDGSNNDLFGKAVYIKDDLIAVGAQGDDNSAGSVYLFEKPANGWQQNVNPIKLKSSDGVSNDKFGFAVQIQDSTILISAPYNEPGAIYIFEKPQTGWKDATESAKIIANDSFSANTFGYSIDIFDNTLAVLARGVPCVYVFEKNNNSWLNAVEKAKLEIDQFSYLFGPVSIYGDNILVGNSYDSNNGEAFLFEKPENGWINATQSYVLKIIDGDIDGFSICFVDLDENNAVIGVDEVKSNRGAVYVFNKPENGWTDLVPDYKLEDTNGESDSNFGSSLAFANNLLVVGADGLDINGKDGGGVFFYQKVFNNPPVDIVISNETCDDNISVGSVVGIFSTIDEDTNDTYSYNLVNGNGSNDKHNYLFKVNADSLKTDQELGSFSGQVLYINVETNDNYGTTYTKAFQINVNSTSSVKSFSSDKLWSVYPNPTTGELFIKIDDFLLKDRTFIEIYSVTGKLVYKAQIDDIRKKIDISSLTPGMYFVKIDDIGNSMPKKIIVN